jgi:hypothetical protein
LKNEVNQINHSSKINIEYFANTKKSKQMTRKEFTTYKIKENINKSGVP